MASKTQVDFYDHEATRLNTPEAGAINAANDPDLVYETAEYDRHPHDKHLDPHLGMCYHGKTTEPLWVETRSLHIHEHIDPYRTIEQIRKGKGVNGQEGFWTERELIGKKTVEFYQHPVAWENRMIAGDSLLVMNSLLERDRLGGQVQTIYFDPPYGISYGSNFQPFTNNNRVGDDDISREPEMVKAFRDTWELGIHSYLSYMRDRLHLCKELLKEEGSIFVQMGDENFARVCLLMDEVFGAENRITVISYATTSGSATKLLPDVATYLLWYAKSKEKIKFRQLYEQLTRKEIVEYFSSYGMVELENGECRKLTSDEKKDPERYLPSGSRLYQKVSLNSQGGKGSKVFLWNGVSYTCPDSRQWSVSIEGLKNIGKKNRLDGTSRTRLSWKRYEEEVPGRRINNLWPSQAYAQNRKYIVETAKSIVQRCILMTTDPGDLVFDPTCGSGTTAYVSEHWGRRWITCDTSRVSLTLARQRLTTSVFPYYKLIDSEGRDISQGFNYRTVPHVSAKTLAYDLPPTQTTLYDQPEIDSKKKRVSGPFAMEALPAPLAPPQVQPFSAENDDVNEDWRDMLLSQLSKTGVRAIHNGDIKFSSLEKYPGRDLDAIGHLEKDGSLAAVVFGQKHAPMSHVEAELAIKEAHKNVEDIATLFFAAQSFTDQAEAVIDGKIWDGVRLLRAVVDPDLLVGDLKGGNPADDSFWLVGQPDVSVEVEGDKYRVRVNGFDYYDYHNENDKLTSGEIDDVAVWLLDCDYDGNSLRAHQIFFPANNGWEQLGKKLKGLVDPDLLEHYHGNVSLPFEEGERRKIAVKVVDNRGIESMRVLNLPAIEEKR